MERTILLSHYEGGCAVMAAEVHELAHALNNDLAMIVGTLEILTVRTDVPADLCPLIQAAGQSAERLTDHVSELRQTVQAASPPPGSIRSISTPCPGSGSISADDCA